MRWSVDTVVTLAVDTDCCFQELFKTIEAVRISFLSSSGSDFQTVQTMHGLCRQCRLYWFFCDRWASYI